MNSFTKRWTLFLLVFPVLALLIAAGCTQSPKTAAPSAPSAPVTVQAAVAEYVGSEACGGCHPAEWNSHRVTYHAHTLQPMTVAMLGKNAPPEGYLPNTNCAIGIFDGRYMLGRPRTREMRPLEYALGSGKQGMTFVAVEPDNAVFEMRKSYIPGKKDWYTTPGQEGTDNLPDVTGKRHPGEGGKKCILCHAVTVPVNSIRPEPRFQGVGCESCHGPGSAHIAAERAGRKNEAKMEDLSGIGGQRVNELCGKCHRTPQDVQALREPLRLSQRFMTYGLAMSPCFQKSGDRLTCMTCHDPHANARTDTAFYERICTTCHAGTQHATPAPSAAKLAGLAKTVCPVNPRSGCIPCHMPTRPVFAGNRGSKIPIAMADHWIRVNRKQASATP